MIHLKNQVLEDSDLVLTDKEHSGLGPNLVLKRCRITLRTNANALTISNVNFVDCVIEAKKKLVNFQGWCAAMLNNCKFIGSFEGNDFGHWDAEHAYSGIMDCDFSDAILNGCRFLECDLSSIKLPRWPCFTITNPRARQIEIESIEWPGEMGHWFNGLSWSPEITTAAVGFAPYLVKKFGGSEQTLRQALERLGNVQT